MIEITSGSLQLHEFNLFPSESNKSTLIKVQSDFILTFGSGVGGVGLYVSGVVEGGVKVGRSSMLDMEAFRSVGEGGLISSNDGGVKDFLLLLETMRKGGVGGWLAG